MTTPDQPTDQPQPLPAQDADAPHDASGHDDHDGGSDAHGDDRDGSAPGHGHGASGDNQGDAPALDHSGRGDDDGVDDLARGGAAPGGSPWGRALPWIGLGVAAAALVGHALHFDFINDDAFISFRYADNLVRHGELTFNPGERVEGYTNFLWTVLMALVMALGGDPVVWSKALGVVCSLGTLGTLFAFSTWWASHQLQGGRARSGLWAAAAPLTLGLSSAFACWTQGGLETSLFTLLVTAGLTRAAYEITTDARLPWSGALFGLAAMTRPDGLLIAALVGLFRGVEGMVRRRSPLPSRQDWIWGGSLLAVFAPYWLWRYSYYGYPMPNTYYAKGDAPLWEPGLRYLGGFLRDTFAWVVAPLALIPWRGARRGAWRLPALVLTVALPFLLYYARVGGDFMALYRFYVPLLPELALVAQEGLASLWGGLSESVERRGAGVRAATWRGAAAALVLVAALGVHNWRLTEKSLEIGSDRGVDSIGWLKMFVGQTTAIGLYLRQAYPPDTSIATTAAGVIPFYSQMRTLDLLALNDVYTAHNVPSSGRRPGHSKAAPERYVLDWRPDLLIKHPRISDKQPHSSPTEQRYWRARGYKFAYAQVPGLQPPFWAWFEAVDDAPKTQ